MPCDYFAEVEHDLCSLAFFQGSAVHKDGSTANGSSEKESNEGKLIKGKVRSYASADLTSGIKRLVRIKEKK